MEYRWYITDDDYELAKRNGISNITLNSRVRSYGWDIKKACTKPLQRTLKSHLPKEILKNLQENEIPIEIYTKRLKSGWNKNKASTTSILTKHESIKIANNSRRRITDEQYIRAEANGISRGTLKRRVINSHWDIEKAIITPVMSKSECAKLSYFSKSMVSLFRR